MHSFRLVVIVLMTVYWLRHIVPKYNSLDTQMHRSRNLLIAVKLSKIISEQGLVLWCSRLSYNADSIPSQVLAAPFSI